MKCGLPESILCGMIITHKQTTLIPPTIHNRLPNGSLVFDDQNVQLGQLGETASKAAITMGDMQFIKQATGTDIQNREA